MSEGWRTARIGDVCNLMTGGTPSRSKPEYFDGTIKWLVSGDIHRGEIQDCEGRITEAGLANSNARYLPLNSVMIALNGQGKTRGTVALLRTEATCNQSLVSIHPKDTRVLLPEFLYVNLHGRYEEIRKMTGDSGNDRRGLNMGLINQIPIPVPPLAEQERIVALLDEAFARIATAKAHAQQNLQNARALFDSHLNAVFSQRGEGWVETTVGAVLTLQRGFDITKRQQNQDGAVPVVSSGGVKSYHDEAKVTGPGVVIGRKGSIGSLHYLGQDFWPHDTTLWVKDFKGNSPKLVYYLLRGLDLAHLDSGTANPALNRNQVHPLRIQWPASSRQQEALEMLESIEASTRQLGELYTRKLAALDELKQSLLHQAFTGELTAQDVEEVA